MWVSKDSSQGYFKRDTESDSNYVIAFSNYGVGYGLVSIHKSLDKLQNMLLFFDSFKSGDEYDTKAITHIMHCNAMFPGALIEHTYLMSKQQSNQQTPTTA